MNIRNLLIMLFLMTPFILAEDYELEEWVDDTIVEGASYLVYGAKRVCFYTFDGKFLHEIEHYDQTQSFYERVQRKLDKSAPKPQPVRYTVEYLGNISISSGGASAVFRFFDIHDHVLAKHPTPCVLGSYYSELERVFKNTLDLSLIKDELSKKRVCCKTRICSIYPVLPIPL